MNNKIVARYLDGRLIKGIALDIDVTRPKFHVRPPEGKAVEVQLRELKALFYVRTLDGDPEHQESKTPDPNDARGRSSTVVALTFKDGEVMVGHTIGNPMNRPYFFIVPVDPLSNNIRVLVNRAALISLEPVAGSDGEAGKLAS
jgi:hypothetical protein